ncbi:MAG: response regulator [Saprospiraceae bacterium]|nr:response regulator [Saprospiraceae bacterium]
MRILIVEDEPLHADRFEMLALQMGYEVVGICDNAFDALDCFHRSHPDLLLLDIQLRGDTDGIQLAERLRQAREVPVIFITSMQDDETFARARRTGPAAFILKPFDLLQLQRAIELAVSGLARSAAPNDFEHTDLLLPDCLFIKVREKLEKVSFDDILFIESEGRYAMLHTVASRKFAIRIPLADLEAKLPPDRFARIHRGYLIHLKWLQSVDLHDMLVKVKDRDLPLGKSFRDAVLERLDQL